MKPLAVFTIFFIASFFIGAAPILLVVGVIWLLACWMGNDPPPDDQDPDPAPPPTPTKPRRNPTPKPPTPPRTPPRRINLTHHR